MRGGDIPHGWAQMGSDLLTLYLIEKGYRTWVHNEGEGDRGIS